MGVFVGLDAARCCRICDDQRVGNACNCAVGRVHWPVVDEVRQLTASAHSRKTVLFHAFGGRFHTKMGMKKSTVFFLMPGSVVCFYFGWVRCAPRSMVSVAFLPSAIHLEFFFLSVRAVSDTSFLIEVPIATLGVRVPCL
jgi:hypothetical protein